MKFVVGVVDVSDFHFLYLCGKKNDKFKFLRDNSHPRIFNRYLCVHINFKNVDNISLCKTINYDDLHDVYKYGSVVQKYTKFLVDARELKFLFI